MGLFAAVAARRLQKTTEPVGAGGRVGADPAPSQAVARVTPVRAFRHEGVVDPPQKARTTRRRAFGIGSAARYPSSLIPTSDEAGVSDG